MEVQNDVKEVEVKKSETVLLPADEIARRIVALAQHVHDFQPELVLAIPNASFVFCADLMRASECDVPIMFVQCLGRNEAGAFRMFAKGEAPDFNGKRILLLDSCLDSGQTIMWMKMWLETKKIQQLMTLVAVDKSAPICMSKVSGYLVKMNAERGNPFIFGYGMDRKDGTGRGLPYIGVQEG